MNRRKFLLNCSCSIIPIMSSFPALAQQRPRQSTPLSTPSSPGTRAANPVPICGTPDPDMAELQRTIELTTRAKESMGTPREIVIPVNFHVIHSGAQGRIEEVRLDQQIEVLNSDFRPVGVSFFKNHVGQYDNPAWFSLVPSNRDPSSPTEMQMKRALARDTDRALNLYSLEPAAAGLLGWATFPWQRELVPSADGIVLRHSTIIGGEGDNGRHGRTATHEVGHWLGLLHTFQNGCSEPGDGVDDTPFQALPTAGCPVPAPSCGTDRGTDPVDNHMNYSSDSCRKQFSAGQIARMQSMTAVFRPRLMKDSTTNVPTASAPSGAGAPGTSTTGSTAAARQTVSPKASPAPGADPGRATGGSGGSSTTDAINQLLK